MQTEALELRPMSVEVEPEEATEDLVNLLNGVELQRSELRAFRESIRADFAAFGVLR